MPISGSGQNAGARRSGFGASNKSNKSSSGRKTSRSGRRGGRK